MSHSKFHEIKQRFGALSPKEQGKLLRDLYTFSQDTKLFLESRLLGGSLGEEFVRQMERETINKVYRMPPGDINGRVVDGIISKAKKSGVNRGTMVKLEQLAYRGFVEFLNAYGGGPETFNSMACRHLENYLTHVKQEFKNSQERDEIFIALKKYLEDQDNMYTDELDQLFEEATGVKIERKSRY